MDTLSLPPYQHRLLSREGRTFIFDDFRKRYVSLTPEEWVRQHFLHWLTSGKGYPAGLIAVEAPLKYNRLAKRADAIVYGRTGTPLMIIECKSPQVMITQDVFDQIARYNFSFKVSYLAVTNGIEHFCCRMDAEKKSWAFLTDFPDYERLGEKHTQA